jgi:hypothetical protein
MCVCEYVSSKAQSRKYDDYNNTKETAQETPSDSTYTTSVCVMYSYLASVKLLESIRLLIPLALQGFPLG